MARVAQGMRTDFIFVQCGDPEYNLPKESLALQRIPVSGQVHKPSWTVLRALLFKNRPCTHRKGFLGGKLASLLLHEGSSSSRSRGMWSFLNLILPAKLFFLARQEATFKAGLKDDSA